MSRIVSVPPAPFLEDDDFLEEANRLFWSSLIDHIRTEFRGRVKNILDIGCHNGGLLARLSEVFRPQSIYGIEPLDQPRERAHFRLRHIQGKVTLLRPDQWSEAPTNSIDLITCHEVLHLVDDLDGLFHQISRTLRPKGVVFIVAGCHTENPLWLRWREQLLAVGQNIRDRNPFDILCAGNQAGLKSFIRPLRRDGWIIYDPGQASFKYDSTVELFDHHYRQKLLFRFVKAP